MINKSLEAPGRTGLLPYAQLDDQYDPPGFSYETREGERWLLHGMLHTVLWWCGEHLQSGLVRVTKEALV